MLLQSWDFIVSLRFNEQPRALERVFNGMVITSFSKGSEVGRFDYKKDFGEIMGEPL